MGPTPQSLVKENCNEEVEVGIDRSSLSDLFGAVLRVPTIERRFDFGFRQRRLRCSGAVSEGGSKNEGVEFPRQFATLTLFSLRPWL
jgi:hypothetical protein